MRLIPRDPFRGLTTLQEQMNRLFDTFGEDVWPLPMSRSWPSVDVVETPETVQVKAELPGMEAGDIEISLAGHMLTIKGEKVTEKEETGKTWHRKERISGRFVRTVPIPADVNAEAIEATHKKGLLTIVLPKVVPETPKKVTVKAT